MKSSGRTGQRLKRFIVTASTLAALCGQVEAQTPGGGKIYSRKNAFRIPFQIPNQNEQKLLEEVQLYVSRDGKTWKKYTSASPALPKEKQSFVFRANEDGEYRFSVRTMDRRGKLNPENDAKLAVGLHVVVDTVAPGIKLQSLPVSGGKVAVGWEIQDKNLNLDTLKLEYRTARSDNWIPIAAVTKKFVGEHSWTPQGGGAVNVRCQVEDFAKNLAIEGVDLNQSSFGGTNRELPDLPGGNSSINSFEPEATLPPNSLGGTTAPPLEFETNQSGPPSGNRPIEFNPNQVPTNPRTGTQGTLPTDDEIINGFKLNTDAPTIGEGSGLGGTQRPSGLPSFSGTGGRSDLGAGGASQNATPPTQGFSLDELDKPRQGGANTAYPSDRMIVSDTDLTMDYELEDVGASGVSQVEVYASGDRGRTWKLVGGQKKPNPQSAIYKLNMKLPGEGLYGLVIVAQNGLGLGDQPPRTGDEPQIWVEIDQAVPAVQLNQPQIKGRQVLITWKAQDSNLDDRPVTLVYDDGNGIRQIAVDVANNGSYIWNVTGNVPSRFRVGIQVQDLAGNKETKWSQDVVADNSRPRARVIGIKPSNRTIR